MECTRIASCLIALALAASTPLDGSAQQGAPAGPVPHELLRSRRQALLDGIGTGVAVVHSAQRRSIGGDYPQDADYREDNDFLYLTGLESPDSWLVLVARADSADEVVLFVPEVTAAVQRWMGDWPGPDSATARVSGIDDVRPAADAAREIRRLATGPAARAGSLLLELGPAERELELYQDLIFDTGVPVADLRPHLAALRVVKDADELRRLRRAIELTVAAQRAALEVIEPGMWEYELEALIEYTFRRGGAERVGFPSIIGSGPNAAVLHYDRSRRRMQAGDLVVIDVGAEWGYHSADVTRTVPVSGRFTPRQRALYELVLGAQRAAIDSVRPGVTFAQLNRLARESMRRHSGELCGAEPCDRYFVHGLGHFLGMDVHDVGDYAQPLAAGAVITIEPGIYIPEEALGIRIEDDVLVTPTGAEVLSAGAPRDPGEIERLMRSRRTTGNGNGNGTTGEGSQPIGERN